VYAVISLYLYKINKMFSFAGLLKEIRLLKIYWLCVYVFLSVPLHSKIFDKVEKS